MKRETQSAPGSASSRVCVHEPVAGFDELRTVQTYSHLLQQDMEPLALLQLHDLRQISNKRETARKERREMAGL